MEKLIGQTVEDIFIVVQISRWNRVSVTSSVDFFFFC